MDPKLLRTAMGLFATGVTVITFKADGQRGGMTANAFMSVSLEPPLVLVSVRTASRFNQWVREDVRFGINILGEDQRVLSGHFSGHPVAGIDPRFYENRGTPLLEGSLIHIVARTVDVHPAGDHLLYIGEVEHLRFGEQRRPLIFYSGKYQQVHTHPSTINANGFIEGW
ncbi:flavin reductase family protein [Burkholderia sp. S171]|uniref:flavin reductase family protein n=1 Tax=Burkholderia sp. S171 TaxID=1641860 RepID=UPI00131DF074|nr:flavin reductase family protein [Burkholderia sp. S171]